ncbi:MAG: metal ABC transporter substrate-binding protein [Oscillospiraceae bacterium]
MKRIISAVLCAVILLCSCSKNESNSLPCNEDGRLSIITTIFPQFDFARNVTGDLADVSMLLPPGAESHSYEPTPKDIIAIQNCDLFIYVGGENDAWIDDILASMGEKSPETLVLINVVDTVDEVHFDSGHAESHKTSDGEHEVEPDEHIWTSVKNAKLMTDAICHKLCEIDPDHSAEFSANAGSYQKRLDNLDMQFASMMQTAKRRCIVVGDRFPFIYLARDYGIEYYAAFSGCAEQCEPSAATIAFLTEKIKEERIPNVFYIEFSNHLVADAIAEATDTKTLLLHSCHNLSKRELDSGADYISVMQQNINNLTEALN